jgi:hypothetical protein
MPNGSLSGKAILELESKYTKIRVSFRINGYNIYYWYCGIWKIPAYFEIASMV